MAKQESFKDAEANGHIKTLPEITETVVESKIPENITDNAEDFRLAIGRAQMDGLDYVEVSERLFNYLVKNQKTNYLTYGSPGIKVFKTGTRDQILREEKLNAEEFSAMEHKKRMEGKH